MSQQQLDAVVDKVTRVFNSWDPETPISRIREDWDNLFSDVVPAVDARSERIDVRGVQAEWIVAPSARADRVILYLHGGGYVLGSVRSHRDICERLSHEGRAKVLALDYRLAPEHPFPAQVEDAVTAYRWLLDQGFLARHIAISGDSAGGGLSLATMLALKDKQVPLPVCAALMSPWVDMELLGDSLTKNAVIDPMIHPEMVGVMVSLFLNGASPRNPLANPLYGDLKGLPPLMIHVGTREVLESDSLRIAERAKAAGVPTEIKVWPGQIHVFHIFASLLDEGKQAVQELGSFIAKHLGS